MKNWEKIALEKDLWIQKIKKINFIRLKIREFFNNRNYLELETPLLVAEAGMEPYLDPFETKVYDINNNVYDAYLITSPEYSMKKILSSGFEAIYQISSVFRNHEDFGGRHNPEFKLLEWYHQNADYKYIMKEMGDLLQFLAKNLFNSLQFTYQSKIIDLAEIEYITVHDAMLKYADVDIDKYKNYEDFKQYLLEHNYDVENLKTWDDCFFLLFLNKVEPKLGNGKLTFLYDYPRSMASLSKIKKDNDFYAERFEAYIAGLELANGFSELLDAEEQELRLKEEQELRKNLSKKVINIDKDFIKALSRDIPESGGVALGLSRLEMIFLDLDNINDLLLFPAKDIFSRN